MIELITINHNRQNIPNNKRKVKTFNLWSHENDSSILEKEIQTLKAEGYTDITFVIDSGNTEFDIPQTITFYGSRLETEEECANRIAQQTAYNEKRLAEEKERIYKIERADEIKRIMAGLTLEELKAMAPLKTG